jgi:hypothetical protein
MIATATEIVVSPEVAPENAESLAFLKELIFEGISRAETLQRQAPTTIIDLAETAVRTGFYLQDAKSFVAGEGQYMKWVESNFSLSYARASQLKRLGKFFARDIVDQKQREKLGIFPKGLDGVVCAEHLRNQIKNVSPKSLSDLFRTVGILPPLALHDGTGTNGNAHANSSRFKEFEGALRTLEKKMDKLNPARLSAADRDKLIARLKPLATLYSTLTSDGAIPEPSCRFSVSDFR